MSIYLSDALPSQWYCYLNDRYEACGNEISIKSFFEYNIFSSAKCMSFSVISCYIYHDDSLLCPMFNSLRPRLNRRPPADDIFKCISLNENEWISPRISLKFVHKVRINNIPALVSIMAWCRPGDKPLSEPMMVNLLMHICVTRPQWVNAYFVFGMQ